MPQPKTLKDFFEVYRPKSPDEQRFVDKHVVIKHKDRNGNGDDVFTASNVKKSPRTKENHGYEPGDDEKVYEEVEALPEESDPFIGNYSYQHRKGHYVKATSTAHPKGGYLLKWADGSSSHIKDVAAMKSTIARAGLMAEEADGLDEAQGSFTRTTPMGKRQKDSWKPASKKPRKDFDRNKRTMKDDDLEEMAGSCDRVSPMAKPARYDASGGRKPRSNFDRNERTIRKADLEEKTLTAAELKKREEIAKAMARENPYMPVSKKMAIATTVAKRVAGSREGAKQIDEIGNTPAGRAALGSYINKRTHDIASRAYEAGAKHDTGTKSKSYKKELAGRAGIERAVKKLTKPRVFRRYYGEELATSFIDKYIPELAETTALSSEDQLVAMLIDDNISEGIAADILMLHNSLDENNQRHLLAAIEAGEIDEVLDFAIQNRGE